MYGFLALEMKYSKTINQYQCGTKYGESDVVDRLVVGVEHSPDLNQYSLCSVGASVVGLVIPSGIWQTRCGATRMYVGFWEKTGTSNPYTANIIQEEPLLRKLVVKAQQPFNVNQ